MIRFASWFAYASAGVSVIQLTLLALFFALGEPYGHLDDEVIIVQYLLAFPLVLALYRLLRPQAPLLSTLAAVLGFAGIVAIVVLQALLVAGTLSFEQQVGPVSVAFFVLFGGWLLITGYVGRTQRLMPWSLTMSVVGWTYVGYPIWAVWLGRRLGAARAQRDSGDISSGGVLPT